ncbi:MAG TPA: hypothetical protein VFS20_15760 [Longimicrobium sp.]|nr:hypothetical protein [Longimicrobium sp.]
MDPLTTTIVAALQKLSEPAVRDAYAGLKALIQRKFGSGSGISGALEGAETKPDSPGRAAVLEEEVQAAAAGRDGEVMAAVAALEKAIGSLLPAATTINQTVSGTGHIFSGSGDIHVTREP